MHINAFPPEILINIFEQGKSTAPREVGGSTLLLAVSQVCAAWRAIAHAYPMLWDDLRLTARSSPQKARNLFARHRGGTVAVTLDRSMAPPDPIVYWNLLNIVMTHAERLRALRFIGPTAALRLLSRACVRHTFPMLRALVVVEPAAELGPGMLNPLSINAPNLSFLSLTGTQFLLGDKDKLPTLRELHLEESKFFAYFDQADGCIEPELLDLEILTLTGGPLPLLRDPSLHPADSNLVALRLWLTLLDVAPDSLAGFFRLVRMPRLQHLDIAGLAGYLWEEFLGVLRPKGHSPPRYPLLKSLTFRSLVLTGIDVNALRGVHSITILQLIDMDPCPLVSILEGDHRVCPMIRELWLMGGEILRLPSRVSLR
ncbi:hypothetical protein DFH09DRAFT_1209473 [Mycena vulgaris]|nr:hypothetical protein DFH09DRAFT_1209473 [Mycena vulgaris]